MECSIHRAAEPHGSVSMKNGTHAPILSIHGTNDRRNYKAYAWSYRYPFFGHLSPPLGAHAIELCCAVALWGAPGLLMYRYGVEKIVTDLLGVPLHPSLPALLMLSFATAYFIVTALLLASTVQRVASGHAIVPKVLIWVPVVPAILLSWSGMVAGCFLLVFGIVTWCFPSML
jgi:hypothetical protein